MIGYDAKFNTLVKLQPVIKLNVTHTGSCCFSKIAISN